MVPLTPLAMSSIPCHTAMASEPLFLVLGMKLDLDRTQISFDLQALIMAILPTCVGVLLILTFASRFVCPHSFCCSLMVLISLICRRVVGLDRLLFASFLLVSSWPVSTCA